MDFAGNKKGMGYQNRFLFSILGPKILRLLSEASQWAPKGMPLNNNKSLKLFSILLF